MLQRGEFYSCKPIIYTCDCKGVRRNCTSLIIPVKKRQQLLIVLGVTFPRRWFIPKQVSQVPTHTFAWRKS